MARLADYGINVSDFSNVQEIEIRGTAFPIAFTLETMEYIADVYDGDYAEFEAAMNNMLKKADGKLTSSTLSPADLKIMRALIYGMLKTGGLEETPETIFQFLGMSADVLTAYSACMEIFADQTFQVEDLKKSKKPQDYQKAQAKRKTKNRNRRN